MDRARARVVVGAVTPQVDDGRFVAKHALGLPVVVEADVFADSHDLISAVVLWRPASEDGSRSATEPVDGWREVAMAPIGDDRWRASFDVEGLGRYEFTVAGWIDRFRTWRRDLVAKVEAGVATELDLAIGAEIVADLVRSADEPDVTALRRARDFLVDPDLSWAHRVDLAVADALSAVVYRNDPRRHATSHAVLPLRVDRERARFSSWYELFPRSAASQPGRHGTLRDVIDRLDYVASMGFDVLYLPPIHPIGRTHRKGPDNTTGAGPDDVGSPWAIGSAEGGHKAIHPALGTIGDFRELVAAAREHGIEVALDIAFQCSPDHPYVREHPDWFRHRPDGSIQYAENPPKRYEDIYPFDFESDDSEGLWRELESIFEHWIAEGVRVFRVDNPHTKSLRFWRWVIDELTREHPDLILLSEAFTRPKVMYELAKAGFSQSYTYFAWRTRKWEIEQYYGELYSPPVVDFFRSNAWPNTPDILPENLEHGGRPAFVQRLVLAATLSASFGIYGPPFELMEHEVRPGSEEYARNEKYELRHWDLEAKQSLRELIARVNQIRRDNPALQQDRTLRFHHIDNDELLVFSKTDRDHRNVILVVVNLDARWTQSGWTWLDLEALGLEPGRRFQVHDLLGDARYLWEGEGNFVALDPQVVPAHVFAVRPLHRTERDFPTYL